MINLHFTTPSIISIGQHAFTISSHNLQRLTPAIQCCWNLTASVSPTPKRSFNWPSPSFFAHVLPHRLPRSSRFIQQIDPETGRLGHEDRTWLLGCLNLAVKLHKLYDVHTYHLLEPKTAKKQVPIVDQDVKMSVVYALEGKLMMMLKFQLLTLSPMGWLHQLLWRMIPDDPDVKIDLKPIVGFWFDALRYQRAAQVVDILMLHYATTAPRVMAMMAFQLIYVLEMGATGSSSG